MSRRNAADPTLLQAAARDAQRQAMLAYAKERPRNLCLLLTSACHIVVAIAAVILCLAALGRANDSFLATSLHKFGARSDTLLSVDTQPPPCGVATPDAMGLLRALNTHVGTEAPAASLQRPEYVKWTKEIVLALCANNVHGLARPTRPTSGTCTGAADEQYQVEFTEELLAISYLVQTSELRPTASSDAAALVALAALFDQAVCSGDGKRYPKREQKRFGNFHGRIAMAYRAAMPAFLHYHANRATCGTGALVSADPFESCTHECHVLLALEAASDESHLLLHTSGVGSSTTIERIYRLLALSVVAHYDRTFNKNACFGNLNVLKTLTPTASAPGTAEEMCAAVYYAAPSFPGLSDYTRTPLENYHANSISVLNAEHCPDEDDGVETNVTRPLPAWVTGEHLLIAKVGSELETHKAVCAQIHRFGGFDVERQFGIADPTRSITKVENAFGSFFHEDFFESLVDDAPAFEEPVARLEFYAAYRVGATALWATLAACCVGFWGGRAVIPAAVILLRTAGGGAAADGVRETLTRPSKIALPERLSVFTTLFAAFWVLFVDPAVQPIAYSSPSCAEWGDEAGQSYSAAFPTNWGKERFKTNGDADVGMTLLIFVAVFFVHRLLFRKFVRKAAAEDDAATSGQPLPKRSRLARLGARLKNEVPKSTFYVFLGAEIVIVILLGTQAGLTGRDLHNAAHDFEETQAVAEALKRDCIASVLGGFFVGGAVGSSRQKWAVTKLGGLWVLLWAAGTGLLVWLPVLVCASLLPKQLEDAFNASEKVRGSQNRLVVWIFLLVAAGTASVSLAVTVRKLRSTKQASGGDKTSYVAEKREKDRILQRSNGGLFENAGKSLSDALGLDASAEGRAGSIPHMYLKI